ncbi:daunorubicin resistance ABC transporter ATPase subunit [Ammonifex degensii KC4]|uniref:Daunorubicin resistance ABC transporter ATPase subunit n=1 Tax=Ammonifex degensii (strain DSM 10501 / KC4) TaxID=429009 RepID=C9RBS8_AMMDK|nr:ATP-binding cassette domain-containing protein [Ammonifex degensii]ACX51705.1 daunorubicin resistance ABC transporter ATPase subunit [Ammonifex degensii KC4]
MIRVENLVKVFGRIRAVDGLSFQVKEGEIFGLLGPNGAGKTTTIRILTMLTRPTAGEVYIAGHRLSTEAEQVKKIIGVVPQHINLDQELTVWENLELHGRLHRIPREERRRRIEELLEFIGLSDRRHDFIPRLSGGMKRRLMIARALMHHPRVLFLDEPTVGLDPQTRRKIWELIRQLNHQGVTILLTTHYIEEAELLCHRVGIVDHGHLIALGTPGELKARLGKVVVENFYNGVVDYHFFGSREEAVNFAAHLPGTVLIREVNLEDVFVELTGRRVRD